MTHQVLTVSSTFPSKLQPIHGVFVKERLRFVRDLGQLDVRVISPVPYFPPIKYFKRWYVFSQIPKTEQVSELSVIRPRFPMPPKIGGYYQSALMYPAIRRASRQLKDFECDFVDAHFVYPDGVAATQHAQAIGRPVVITCRGEDILRFPSLPVIGNRIRWALQRANAVVALSDEIAAAAIEHGADENRVTVIPNGVDTEKFSPIPIAQARQSLGLPQDRKIVVSVGYRLERKGFHILVDALPKLIEQFPDLLLVIVGGPARWGQDYTSVIESRIAENKMSDHVQLAGPQEQSKLPMWYSAADLFALMTSREGSPNVLMEALASGVPAVATPIGGIPEVLSDERLGMIVPERTAESAAITISQGLRHPWDRGKIREIMEGRSWRETATRVLAVFDQVAAQQAIER